MDHPRWPGLLCSLSLGAGCLSSPLPQGSASDVLKVPSVPMGRVLPAAGEDQIALGWRCCSWSAPLCAQCLNKPLSSTQCPRGISTDSCFKCMQGAQQFEQTIALHLAKLGAVSLKITPRGCITSVLSIHIGS